MAPRSEVWKHFTSISKVEARCKQCLASVSHSGNTTNLWSHLELKHFVTRKRNKEKRALASAASNTSSGDLDTDDPDDPGVSENNDEVPRPISLPSSSGSETAASLALRPQSATQRGASDMTPPGKKKSRFFTLEDSWAHASSFEEKGKGTARMNQALLFMIVKDNVPFSTVESEGFQNFVKEACPRYRLPSRKTITRMIDEKFESLQIRVKEHLCEMDAITLTCDVWTNTLTTTSYLGLTVHFLHEGAMSQVTVGVTQLEEAHTARNLAAAIMEICTDWGIDLSKVKIIVTDNGANIKAAVVLLIGAARHLPCFAHTLNLVAEAAMKIELLDELLRKVKAIVTFTKQSVRASDLLRKLQIESGKTEGTLLKLIQAVPTRWSSEYLMCDRFIELSDFVGTGLLHSNGPAMLTGPELTTLKSVRTVLKPLYDVTVELSAEKHTSTSKVIPLVSLMKQVIAGFQTLNDPVLVALQRTLTQELDKRFQNIELVDSFAIASLLDPRFKKLYFSSPIAHSHAVTKVTTMLVTRYNQAEASTAARPVPDCPAGLDSLWQLHDVRVAAMPQEAPEVAGSVSVELRQFLNQPVCERSADPLIVWHCQKKEYPHLYPIALDYLSRVATSVPSERLFSKAGNIASQTRNRLTGKRLSKLLFLGSLDKNLFF